MVTLGLLSAAGFVVSAALPEPQADAIPWKDISGGGAAIMLLGALVLFLKFLREDRSARDAERARDREHVEAVVNKFHETTYKLGSDFSATSTTLINIVREDSHIARRELQDLVRDIKKQP